MTTVERPAARQQVPILKCWARVRWSEGSESDVSLWTLLDSDDNIRVRWDEIANVSRAEDVH